MLVMKKVSIPIWCDYKAITVCKTMHMALVSIPIWCDYKDIYTRIDKLDAKFQFQYGAIISEIR